MTHDIPTHRQDARPSWWQTALEAQHPVASPLVRLVVFVWVASLPSLTILTNIAIKWPDEVPGHRLMASFVHYYLSSIFWPMAVARYSRSTPVFELLVLQVLAILVVLYHFMATTRKADSLTFRHVLPTGAAALANSLVTWAVGVVAI